MAATNPPQRRRLSSTVLPTDLLAAIGDVTVNWTIVLNMVEIAIWGMLALTVRQGSSLTSRFRFAGIMDMFTSIGENFFKEKSELAEYREIRKRIFDLYAERNSIEHATWSHPEGWTGPSIRVRIRKDLSIDAKPVSAADIEKLCQDIIDIVMDLDAFMTNYIPEPAPSSQNKSP